MLDSLAIIYLYFFCGELSGLTALLWPILLLLSLLLGCLVHMTKTDLFYFSPGLVTTASAFLMAYGGVVASQVIYAKFLNCIVKSPMQFYEQTPMGRLLNRFSEDIAEVDYAIHFSVRSLMNLVLQCTIILGVIISTTPTFTIIIPPLAIIYIYIQVCLITVHLTSSHLFTFICLLD